MEDGKRLGTRIIVAAGILAASHIVHGMLTSTDVKIWDKYSADLPGAIGVAAVVAVTAACCLWARRMAK